MNHPAILKRLFDFYHRSKESGEIELSESWKLMASTAQASVIAALESRDSESLERILNLAVDHGSIGIEHAISAWNSPALNSHLKSLSHSLGLLPVLNPEQPFINNHTLPNYNHLVPLSEEITGLKLNVDGLYGFNSTLGLPVRYLFYVAAAHAATSFLGRRPRRVLELGAGFGDLGFIASQWKCSSYTVIDLPQTAVLSAYFMAQCLGEKDVWLYGEDGVGAFARFYPANAYQEVAELARYDLIWNTDSLPEMTQASQDRYLNLFNDRLANDGIFLSVNHEAINNGQSRVWDAVKRCGGFVQRSRFPFLQRPGYVLEIFTR